MALIVEDGTGMATAQSLASVAEADAYHVGHAAAAAWTALSTPVKEARLTEASTRVSDDVKWHGWLVSDAQALAHPRTGLYDRSGNAVASDEVHRSVKRGVIELARLLGTSSIASGTARIVVAETIGPLSKTYGDRKGALSHFGLPVAVAEFFLPFMDLEKRVMRA